MENKKFGSDVTDMILTGSKVWEDEYLEKIEDDNNTTFNINKPLGYLEDYIRMLVEYKIGHCFYFHNIECNSYNEHNDYYMTIKLLDNPFYSRLDIKEPDLYFVRIAISIYDHNDFLEETKSLYETFNVVINIEKKIINSLLNNLGQISDYIETDSYISDCFFENVFREN